MATGEKEEAAGEAVELAFWYDAGWSEEGLDAWKAYVFEAYSNNNPNVQIEMTAQPNIYDTTRTSLAAQSGPDLIMTYGGYAIELAKADYLHPLNDYIDSYAWRKKFAPWALNMFMNGDDVSALPDEIETFIVYYNKTLFTDMGWTVPKTYWELIDLCGKIDEEDIIPFAHSQSGWRGTNEWFMGEFFSQLAGTDVFSDVLQGKLSWNNPGFVDAVKQLTDLQQKGWFMGGLDRYYTVDGTKRNTALAKGEAAIGIGGDLGDK